MTDQKTGGGSGAPEPRGGSKPGLSPEDDYANVKNPNNSGYEADAANRARQAKETKGGG
ncbi:MAG: hypothetical protein JWM27_4603 [Gemmatimonadetes bacterium]|nr:hypothetical protein [Gemmatimonadota bacterium]